MSTDQAGMDPRVKAMWLEALRSGDYKKGKHQLRDKADKFCCLGVLCELAVQEGVIPPPVLAEDEGIYDYGRESDQSASFLPGDVAAWSGIGDNNPGLTGGDNTCKSAASWNDGETTALATDDGNAVVEVKTRARSFRQIASMIERSL